MKNASISLWLSVAGLVLSPAGLLGRTPLGTTFTYQGQLQESDGTPVAEATCDFVFELWADALSVDPGGPPRYGVERRAGRGRRPVHHRH